MEANGDISGLLIIGLLLIVIGAVDGFRLPARIGINARRFRHRGEARKAQKMNL